MVSLVEFFRRFSVSSGAVVDDAKQISTDLAPPRWSRADAVPKKRGPKTDVLEALLKRVDGLEAKLKEKNDGEKTPTTPTAASAAGEASATVVESESDVEPKPKRLQVETNRSAEQAEAAIYSPASER